MAVNVFSHHGIYLFNMLILGWYYSASNFDQPGVLIPDKCLVGKDSCYVIYYVTGLIL